MKKIIFSILTISITMSAFAQEAADKKVQAGLVVGSGLAFQKMGTKYIANAGGNDLTVGANVNFSLSETIGFCTGLEFDFETLKYKAPGAKGENVYYYFNDTDILRSQDVDLTSTSTELFQLTERRQKAVYLTVPTMLTFRTKFFGYFRYFGKFGLRNSFLLKSHVNDEGYTFLANNFLTAGTAKTNENMIIKNETIFFKSAFGLCGGAEWNFSGSTSLIAELGYYYGFTQLYWKNDGTVAQADRKTTLFASGLNNGTGNDVHFSNRATQSQVMLKISILF
jgi:hypothetical protein